MFLILYSGFFLLMSVIRIRYFLFIFCLQKWFSCVVSQYRHESFCSIQLSSLHISYHGSSLLIESHVSNDNLYVLPYLCICCCQEQYTVKRCTSLITGDSVSHDGKDAYNGYVESNNFY